MRNPFRYPVNRAMTWMPLASAFLWLSPAAMNAQQINPQFRQPTLVQKQQSKSAMNQLGPRTTPTEETIVFLQPGTNPQVLANRFRMRIVRALKSDPNAYIFAAPSVQMAQMFAQTIRSYASVRYVANNAKIGAEKYQFVPNDPYFTLLNPANRLPWQWHLSNKNVFQRDIRVRNAWNRNQTGVGVTIGIVDDGLQTNHPDLSANYDAADSSDFGGGDSDPNPVTVDDNHGTAVAGLAAARGNNGIGSTGVAPLANVAGLRLDFNASVLSTADLADANLFHSNSASSTIQVKNHSYGIPDSFVPNTDEDTAMNTSASFGTLHVRAAGNARGQYYQDANKQMPQNNPNSITIAAMGSDGVFASYSSFGANVFCTAPSSSDNPYTMAILTTDRTGNDGYNTGVFNPPFNYDLFPDANYTSLFGGTSAASPIAAGVMALGKQVRPNMDVRFAKHLLAMTSVRVHTTDVTDTSDGGWKKNGAGFWFNQNYGFGLINADGFTYQAGRINSVTPPKTTTVATTNVAAAIPDAVDSGGVTTPGSLSRTFTIASTNTTPLESVQLTVDITHPYRGDVSIILTSPFGTTSRLCSPAGGDGGSDVKWTFSTNAFWGENPAGTWTVKVQDNFAQDAGTWNNYSVTLNQGRIVAVPVLASLSPASVAVGSAAFNLTVNGDLFTPESFITWNGTPLVTRFVSITTLQARISSSLVTTLGTATINVTTPAPGGSNPFPLTFFIGPKVDAVINGTPTRDTNATSDVLISIRAQNNGSNDATGVKIDQISVVPNGGSSVFSAQRNVSLGTLAPGAFADTLFRFRGTTLTSGAAATIRVYLTFNGTSYQQNIRFTIP